MINNYVISLKNAKERREHIQTLLSKNNISFNFFDALEPSEYLEQLIKDKLPNLIDANLSKGEIGCLMSHLLLWEKLIKEDLSYITIFEDDILLGENANKILSNYSWLEDRLDINNPFILRLETHLMPIYPIDKELLDKNNSTFIEPIYNRNILILNNFHYGTAGYIISKHAAIILISLFKKLSKEEFSPIDVLMFKRFLKNEGITNYQLNPAICVQDSILNKEKSKLYSVIEHTPQAKRINLVQRIFRVFTKVQRLREKKKAKKTIIPFR